MWNWSPSAPCQVEKSFFVSTTDELKSVVASQAFPGCTIILADGDYEFCQINYEDFSPKHINIRAANRRAVKFNHFVLGGTTGCHYFRFEGIQFQWEVSGTSLAVFDTYPSLSDNNQWVDCEFFCSVDNDPNNDCIGLRTGGANTYIVGCDFHDINLGMALGGGPMYIAFNRVYDTSRDAVNLTTGRFVTFEENVFERYITGSAHPDCIQTFTTGTTTGSEDIIVRRNILFDPHGHGVQGLFLQANSGYNFPLKRWTIEDNLFVHSSTHGIYFETDAEDCIIRNNTDIGNFGVNKPKIELLGGRVFTNMVVENNVCSDYALSGDYTEANNYTTQWDDNTLPTHFDNLLLNFQRPDTLQDCLPIPGSALDLSNELGAYKLLSRIPPPPIYIIAAIPSGEFRNTREFTAVEYTGGDLPGSGVTYNWDFGDGNTIAGNPVTHTYANAIGWMRATCTVTATGYSSEQPKTILISASRLVDITCDNEFINTGESLAEPSSNPSYDPGGDPSFTGSYADGGVVLTGTNSATLNNCGDKLSGMKKCTISIDCKRTGGGTSAYLLSFLYHYYINLPTSGTMAVRFAGNTATAAAQILYDGNWHNIHAVYDSVAGTMTVRIDGNTTPIINQTGLSGEIPLESTSRALIVGNYYSGAGGIIGGAKNIVILNEAVEYEDFATVLADLRSAVGTPRIASPTAVKTGSTTATCGITTDQAGGTLYVCCTIGNNKPNSGWVKKGYDYVGNPTPNTNAAVSSSGVRTLNVTGLAPATLYYSWFMHFNAHELSSRVEAGPTFTTDA